MNISDSTGASENKACGGRKVSMMYIIQALSMAHVGINL